MNLTKKVFFLHIPKTGGEFINNLLRKLVPDDQYLEHLQNYVHLEDKSFLEKRFLSGHIPLKRFHKIVHVYSINSTRPVLHLTLRSLMQLTHLRFKFNLFVVKGHDSKIK